MTLSGKGANFPAMHFRPAFEACLATSWGFLLRGSSRTAMDLFSKDI